MPQNNFPQKMFIGLSILAVFALVFLYVLTRTFFQEETAVEASNAGTSDVFVSDPLITVVPDEYLQNDTPVQPTVQETDPSKGNENSQITFVVFSNFESQLCKEKEEIVSRIYNEYKDRIKIVWKDSPNPRVYPHSQEAAEAARCAQEQGKFWEYHDILFQKQESLEKQTYIDSAEELGLDVEIFTSCIDNRDMQDRVLQNYIESKTLGIDGTPFFYVNNQSLSGPSSYEDMKTKIDQVLVAL